MVVRNARYPLPTCLPKRLKLRGTSNYLDIHTHPEVVLSGMAYAI